MKVINQDSGESGRLFCEGETSLIVWRPDGLVVWPKEWCLLKNSSGHPKAVRRERRKKNRGHG